MGSQGRSDFGQRKTFFASCLAVFLAVFGVALAVADGGELTQKPGPAGCVSATGTSGACQDGRALHQLEDIALSPDGRHVYVVSRSADAVAILDRDPDTGQLKQKEGEAGCVSGDGTDPDGGVCRQGRALDFPRSIVVSPDGLNVYVVSFQSDAVAIFKRDLQTGELEQPPGPAGCVSEDGSGGTCQDGRALGGAGRVAISPDGAHVYVVSRSGAEPGTVAIFDRDPETGELEQKAGEQGCLAEFNSGDSCRDAREIPQPNTIAISPDGRNAYIGSDESNAVAAFERDPVTGALTQLPDQGGCISEDGSEGDCQDGKTLQHPNELAISPDGESVYLTSFGGPAPGAVAVFDRDPATGELEQAGGEAGCIAEDGSEPCRDGRALTLAQGIAVSPDGNNVYVSSIDAGLVVFNRDPATGELNQAEGGLGCIGSAPGCTPGTELAGILSVAVTPDGANLYGASLFFDSVFAFGRGPASPPPPPPKPDPPADGPPTVSPPPNVAPIVSGVKVMPSRFRTSAGKRTKLAFTLSEQASVTIAIQRPAAGRRVGTVCKPAPPRPSGDRPCRRFVEVGALDNRDLPGGEHAIPLAGVLARALKPGSYRATIVATDPAAAVSERQTAGFTVVGRRS